MVIYDIWFAATHAIGGGKFCPLPDNLLLVKLPASGYS
jgi:hypothetical protein